MLAGWKRLRSTELKPVTSGQACGSFHSLIDFPELLTAGRPFLVQSLYCVVNSPVAQLQVKEGGYDKKVTETASVLASKSAEVGQKGWTALQGFIATAATTVQQYTGDTKKSPFERSPFAGSGGGSKYGGFGSDSEPGYQAFGNGDSGAKDFGGFGDEKPVPTGGKREDWDDWGTSQAESSPAYAGANAYGSVAEQKSAPRRGSGSSRGAVQKPHQQSANSDAPWSGWGADNDEAEEHFNTAKEKKEGKGWDDWGEEKTEWTGGGFR